MDFSQKLPVDPEFQPCLPKDPRSIFFDRLGDSVSDQEKHELRAATSHSVKSYYCGAAISDQQRYQKELMSYLDHPGLVLLKRDYVRHIEYKKLEPLARPNWFPPGYQLIKFTCERGPPMGVSMNHAEKPSNWQDEPSWSPLDLFVFCIRISDGGYGAKLGFKPGDIPILIHNGQFTCASLFDAKGTLADRPCTFYVLRCTDPAVIVRPQDPAQFKIAEHKFLEHQAELQNFRVEYEHDLFDRDLFQTTSSDTAPPPVHTPILVGDEDQRKKNMLELYWEFLLQHPLPQHPSLYSFDSNLWFERIRAYSFPGDVSAIIFNSPTCPTSNFLLTHR